MRERGPLIRDRNLFNPTMPEGPMTHPHPDPPLEREGKNESLLKGREND